VKSIDGWVIVSFNDDTGLGSMGKEIKTTLGIKKHIVCKSKKLNTLPINSMNEILIDESTNPVDIDSFLEGERGIICFEYVNWHPKLAVICKKRNIKIVCVPMWEWFRGTDIEWRFVDWFLCPNQKALDIVNSYGYRNASKINWALDLNRIPKREVVGKAKQFFHNAGIVDDDDRKGTFAAIKAFSKVKNPSIKLTVRIQKKTRLPPFLDNRVNIEIGNHSINQLYMNGDVAIQPSKMEGLGFMILEPICCGIPVITSDIAPINEYGRQNMLRVKTKWFNRKSFAKVVAKINHAHIREPSITKLSRAIDWCTKNTVTEISNGNRKWAEKSFDQKLIINEWSSMLKKIGES
jgi:glycosyltransferase involved in cell wall biosynthesis